LNGFSNTIASLSQTTLAGGQVQLAPPGVLTVNNAAADLFTGTFTGNGALRKTNTGTLTLTGNSASYTGQNQVLQGTEIVDGALGGPIVVDAATLSGIGSVGALTTSPGASAIVDPGSIGTTTTGILHSGAAGLDSSATFRVLLNSASGNTNPIAG